MTPTAALYDDAPLTLLHEEQEDTSQKWEAEDEAPLILEDDEFEIDHDNPPDDGSWIETLFACPYPFEIPPRSKHCTPPIEL